MRHTIDTAPKDGEFVIIVDDTSGRFDIARWSSSREWMRENGEPSKVKPSHWNPISGQKYPVFQKEQPSGGHQEGAALLPVTPDAPPSTGGFVDANSPTSGEPEILASVQAQTSTVFPKQRSYRRSALAISAALIAVLTTIGVFRRAEAPPLWIRFETVLRNQIWLASQGLPRPIPAAHEPAEHTHDQNQSVLRDNARIENVVETAAPEARQTADEKDQLTALKSQLAAAQLTINTVNQQLQAETAKAQSLEQERDQAAASRKQMETTAQQLRVSVEEEKARVAALASKLSAASHDLDTQSALSSKAQDEAKRLSQAAENTTAELRRSLQEERDKTASLMHELETAQRLTEVGAIPEPTAGARITQAKAGTAPASSEPDVQESPEAVRLMARANALLAQGNIGAARTVFERALDTGSAKASFALAETYDPNILARWGTLGTLGDASKARELYEKAAVDGNKEAKDRINSLR